MLEKLPLFQEVRDMNKSKDRNKSSDAVSHFYPEYHAVKENPLLNEAIVVLPDSKPLWSLMLGLFRVCSCLEVCGVILFVFLRAKDLEDLVAESVMTTEMGIRPSIPCAPKATGVEDNALTMRTGEVQNG
jgi:hypothetical protein